MLTLLDDRRGVGDGGGSWVGWLLHNGGRLLHNSRGRWQILLLDNWAANFLHNRASTSCLLHNG